MSDLSATEYAKARFLMDSVERQDPCIKEATLCLDPDLIDLDAVQIEAHPPQHLDDLVDPQEAPTLPLDLPNLNLSQIFPFNPDVRIRAHRTLPLPHLPNPPVQPSNNPLNQEDEIVAFNITHTIVAEANLDHAARPRRGPRTPEHNLIVIEDSNTITHILNFFQPCDPMDIIEAWFNHSLNISHDEGIDASSNFMPSNPPPTPSSSTEAEAGSTEKDHEDAQNNDALILSDDEASAKEDTEEDKEEEEKGEKRKDHAN